MRRLRIGLVSAGVLTAAYGVLLMLRQDVAALLELTVWAVAAVLLHDAVLVPVTLAAGWVSARLVPARRGAAVVVCAVVLGPLTLAAIPVLGRFGARPDNTTLLDRPYVATVVVLWVVGVGAAWVAGGVRSEEPAAARRDRPRR